MSDNFFTLASDLTRLAQNLYTRGWMLGTSGNLSVRVESQPLKLAITPSGAAKGELIPEQILLIDENGQVINHAGKPSDEGPLHICLMKQRGAGAVVHTHSVWSTILSDFRPNSRGLQIEGYEMLKGLQGVKTHLHQEWIPIFDNSQDMSLLATKVTQELSSHENVHAFLLRRHGMYTWGRDLKEAQRHVEILEFLLETVGRTRQFT